MEVQPRGTVRTPISLVFFDTNILVYADDSTDPMKQKRAIQLIADSIDNKNGVISVQVLQEYFVAVTGKKRLDPLLAQQKIENLIRSLNVVHISEQDVIRAIELHRLDRVSFWDALIVTTARIVNAGVLYSEDLQTGRKFGGTLKIVNPFEKDAFPES